MESVMPALHRNCAAVNEILQAAGLPGESWAAGGIPQAVLPLTYDELLRLTGGAQADVS